MSEGMQSNQMQNYPGYNRGNFCVADQHGGLIMAGNVDCNDQSAQFSGQFPHNPVRPSYTGMAKSSMPPVRAGLMPPGMGMIPGSYNPSQRMMAQSQGGTQSGPTPTLNHLLQTSSSGQRFPGNYTDMPSQGKGGELGGGVPYPAPQQGWNGNSHIMGSFPQTPMAGTTYKSQGSSMAENRHPSGVSAGQGPCPGYHHQGQHMSSPMAASVQRYMAGQVRPSHMPHVSSHGYTQQMPPHSLTYSPPMPNQPSQPASLQQQQQQQQMYHGQQQQPQPPGQPSPTLSQQQLAVASSLQLPSCRSQGPSPTLASPASQGMVEQNSSQEPSHGEDHKREHSSNEPSPSGGVQAQLAVTGGVRLVPSPAGSSSGSRSNTPASNSGAQVGSPMPPRPPSSQVESQNYTSHSPMATQASYSQQIMPPPTHGQMGYPGSAGSKMSGAGMGGTQVPPHFPQYTSQYSQGSFRGQPGLVAVQGSAGAVPGGCYSQAMYNGHSSQMGPGGPGMYMMSRNLQNYNPPYGPGSNMPMNSHYGSFNSHIGHGQGPGAGPGPGQSSAGPVPMGPGQMMGGQAGMNSKGQSGMGVLHGASMMPGGKGAQAAAQAALMAAASSAGTRMPSRGMPMSPRMMGPHGSGSSSPGMMNHMVGNLGSPSLASMSNQIQQITVGSVTGSSKPSSPVGSCPVSSSSSNATSTPIDNSVTSVSTGSQSGVIGSSSNGGGCSAETPSLMSPLSGSDTQESSRPNSTATPGQLADTSNTVSDMVGCDGSGSMPGSDSTSVDSGFHSAADHSEKPPSESNPIHSSSPSSSIPPPSANGQCEDAASQASLCKVMSSTSTSIPTSVHSAATTTTVINASGNMAVTFSSSTSGSSGTQSAGSQTTTSMPLMMNTGTNSSPINITPNGSHYPHPHPGMGYPAGPQGAGPMGHSYMMSNGSADHPGLQHVASMYPYHMPPGSMANNVGSGNMRNSVPPSGVPTPNSTPSGSMPGHMPRGSIPSNMPSGSMPSDVASGSMPSNMPSVSMPSNMPARDMPSNMPPGSMHSNMASRDMPGSMPPGSMSSNMPPGNMPSNMAPRDMPSNMPHNMAPRDMPSNMALRDMPSNMPPGSMPSNMALRDMPSNMPPGSMPSNMAPRDMASHMPPGSVSSNMPPGSVSSNMPPGNMPSTMPPGNLPGRMPPGSMPTNMAASSVPPESMPSNMPPGSMPTNMPPESMPSNMPPGSMPTNMPPGSMPTNMPPGSMPTNMPPGSMPSNMPPGNMPTNMPPGSMPNTSGSLPSNMPPGNMPNTPGNMPSGNMPNNTPGNMPNNMPPGNMPSNMPPGNMSPGSMPNNTPGNMPGSMPPGSMPSNTPGSMPNNMPPGSMPSNTPHGSVAPGSMMSRGGLLNNHLPPTSTPPGAMPNCLPPGSAPNHMAHTGTSSGGPARAGMDELNHHHSGGPSSMKRSAPQAPAVSEELPEKKKKKANDVTRLYDMGSERDRRPFLDKLFAFLEEKGTPLTTMPTISKQPLDLFTLYHSVREKGGMVEVNNSKRWKEICSVVNIGTSASAAFTLKKNYIRYLFAFECMFDHGGLDPTPIVQEIEAQLERKRECKKRGSQNSQDAFQQPPTPNSQMMDGYPGGPGMPPSYIQGPDGQMIPAGMGGHGPGMMIPNNMMGHPNMMPPHPGSGPGMMGHGPSGMMMNSGMPSTGPSQNMMGPQGGMMNSGSSMVGPGGMMGPGMHMGPNTYNLGPPNSMMGPGSSSCSNSSMGPSPGPPMVTGSSSTTTNTAPSPMPMSAGGAGSVTSPTAPSISLPPCSTPNSRPTTADSVSVQDPFADEPSKASSPGTFQHRPGGPTPSPTPGGFPSPGPPTTSSTSGYGSRPSSTSNPSSGPFPSSPASDQSSNFRRSAESFQSSSMFTARSESARFPFGHESHSAQPYRPVTDTADPSFTPRFPGQQPPFPAGGSGEAFNNSHPFLGHGASLGPRMPGQEHFSSYPSPQHPAVRPPIHHEGSFSGPAGGCVSQYLEWIGAGGMGQSPYPPHVEPYIDYNMSGREGTPWSPMHAQRSYPPSSGTPDMLMGPFVRQAQRGSPLTKDKVLGRLQQKGSGILPTTPFALKREIVFPEDSVEAVQPTLKKRRRLTHKDLAPVEAWRLMMALKSGLLAESTWAIDTLNILLFDDTTVTYFSLAHMPGLLEVLTEHFRASLFHTFHILHDRELQGRESLCNKCPHEVKDDDDDDDLAKLIERESEASVDPKLYSSNYTWVSQQGKMVVKEEQSTDCAVLDAKHWDLFSSFTSGKQHWQKGGGDIIEHVVPCFESSVTHRRFTQFHHPQRTCRKEGAKEGQTRQAAGEGNCVLREHCNCQGDPEKQCCKKCGPANCLKDCSEKERVWVGCGVLDKHSNMCNLKGHRNHSVLKVEVKEEPQESELSRCESDDSLPPPVLPAATKDSPVSCEESVLENESPRSTDMEEKPAPPVLTCEGLDEEEIRNEGQSCDLPSLSTEMETNVQQKTITSRSQSPREESENDEMTAEIVAMMIREEDEKMEEEAYHHDGTPLVVIQPDQEELGRRCVAISNIFRSLSCIPGNEALLSKHQGFMLVVGQLLLLHHWHPPCAEAKPAPPLVCQQDVPPTENKKDVPGEAEAGEDGEEKKDWSSSPDWWWDTLESVRENMLVVLANICSHMHMRDMDNGVCLPILNGLLHWMVCPSSTACDPFPSASSSSQLSPQRLVMEALCKLCIDDDNVDLLLATPPFSRILLLLNRLMRFLSERSQQVPREFSIVLLSRLARADPVAARAIALQHASISLLLEFLESAEQSAMAATSQQRGSVASNNPEVLGTSLDMLCRVASTLLYMVRVPESRRLFLHHQSRLLALVMSQILDTEVTQIISDVLFECSQSDLSPT